MRIFICQFLDHCWNKLASNFILSLLYLVHLIVSLFFCFIPFDFFLCNFHYSIIFQNFIIFWQFPFTFSWSFTMLWLNFYVWHWTWSSLFTSLNLFDWLLLRISFIERTNLDLQLYLSLSIFTLSQFIGII